MFAWNRSSQLSRLVAENDESAGSTPTSPENSRFETNLLFILSDLCADMRPACRPINFLNELSELLSDGPLKRLYLLAKS